jgi:hypothetical protein
VDYSLGPELSSYPERPVVVDVGSFHAPRQGTNNTMGVRSYVTAFHTTEIITFLRKELLNSGKIKYKLVRAIVP